MSSLRTSFHQMTNAIFESQSGMNYGFTIRSTHLCLRASPTSSYPRQRRIILKGVFFYQFFHSAPQSAKSLTLVTPEGELESSKLGEVRLNRRWLSNQ